MGMNATIHAKDDAVQDSLGRDTWQAVKSTNGALHVTGAAGLSVADSANLERIADAAEDTSPVDVTLTGTEYETVAASQTAQTIGATGATGDRIEGILVIPASTSPGVVTLLDNATSINVFAGGASSVSNLVPFFIPLGIKSVSGAWKITTGASVSCIAVGDFT